MPSEWKEEKLKYKYAEIPEEPTYRKKKPKKKVSRSDHKHLYRKAIFTIKSDYTHRVYFKPGKYCTICGKIKDIAFLETYPSLAAVEESGLPFFEEPISFSDTYVAIE